MNNLQRASSAALLSALAGSVAGQPCQPWWRVRFAPLDAVQGTPPGIPGRVKESAVFDDDGAGPRPEGLYVAGFFSYMGDVRSQGISRWDGTTWSRLGAMPGAGLSDSSGTLSMAVWGPLPARKSCM